MTPCSGMLSLTFSFHSRRKYSWHPSLSTAAGSGGDERRTLRASALDSGKENRTSIRERASSSRMPAALCTMPRIASPSSRVFRPDAAKPADILASFQRFYFDTALSSRAAALPSLKSFGVNGRILFGTDFPFAPADIRASFTAKLGGYDGLTADEHAAIHHGNAWVLFPRLTVADASKEVVKLAM
jgi:hypothetical protein